MSWLTNLLTVLQAVVAAVAFLISVIEAVHEGIKGAGAEKKRKAMEQWAQVRNQLRDAVKDVLGDKVLPIFDFLASDKVVSVVIDLLVLLFNLKGLFPKST